MANASPPRGESCETCGRDARYSPEPRCRACFSPVSLLAPNVSMANTAEEKKALGKRFKSARSRAKKRGYSDIFAKLKQVADKTEAVVNVEVGYAHHLLTSDKALYAPYAKQVQAGTRAAALMEHGRQRSHVESWVFGEWGDDLVYAALSADGRGLTSYGPVHLALDSRTIAHRTSVLEENSYHFMERHRTRHPDAPPPGYRAAWQNRNKVAAAKIAGSLDTKTQEKELPKLLLSSEGDRDTDRFIEAHIYYGFNWQAVSSIHAPPCGPELSELENALLKATEHEAGKKKIGWVNQ